MITKNKTHRIMKNFIVVILMFSGVFVFAQQKYFYIELKPQTEEIQFTKQGKKYSFENLSADFASFLVQQNIQDFSKAYPDAVDARLKRIYKVRLKDSLQIEQFSKRNEIKHVSAVDFPDISSSFPNDYFINGKSDTALDLIRAPQAWHITKGNPDVIVGVVDKGFDLEHEDLKGKIVSEIQLGRESTLDHGTGVAGFLAGNTNNGKGFASIGYQTRMAIVNGVYSLEDGLDSISKLPGIRIINASWGICNVPNSKRMKKLDTIIKRLEEEDILLVAAAGNGKQMKCKLNENDLINGYHFPASFDTENVISVTSVGNRYPYGHYSEKYKKSGWRDCHENNPFTDDERLLNSHTHNDRVDITAPGLRINILTKGNNYEYDKWGTSQATPMVAGTAALMLAVNPNLTAKEMKEILLNTADDIYHLPCNEKYKGLLGKGRLNAYRAVLTAKCMNEKDGKVDLMIRDAADDFGEEPYAGNNYDWQSPDIWVRAQNDGKLIEIDQSADLRSGKKAYIYVRVTNTGCKTSSGNEKLTLYWGKEAEKMPWPVHWNGVRKSTKGKKLGGQIKSVKIPKLEPGQETIVEIPWKMPKTKDYVKTPNHPGSFYLLTHIASTLNPNPETEAVVDYIVNSKKMAWKRIWVK